LLLQIGEPPLKLVAFAKALRRLTAERRAGVSYVDLNAIDRRLARCRYDELGRTRPPPATARWTVDRTMDGVRKPL